MPYSSVAELPPAVRRRLHGSKLRQWMHVWNSSYSKHGDEQRAFAEAWAAVRKGGDAAKALKSTKDEAEYQSSPKGSQKCEDCTMFRVPYSCTAVGGEISPRGWCKLFERIAKLGKAAGMTKEFNFFLPIAKVDKEKRTVSGYASTPTKDSDGEIVTLEAVRGALPDYMSYGNIREMHALKAVGVAQEANVDAKGLFLTAKIVDDSAWKKCLEGVYKGFSIGGRKLEKTGEKITEIELTEISVVDRPANPDCRITIAKSAKAIEGAEGHLLKVKTKKTAEQKAIAKLAKVVGDLAKAGPPAAHDGFSLPAKMAATVNDSPKDDDTQNNKAAPPKPEDASAAAAEAKPEEDSTDPAAPEKKKKKKKSKAAKKLAKKMEARRIEKAFGLNSDSFLQLKKGMSVAGQLSYTFDSVRSAQRSLMMEGNREGGDKKDQDLARKLGGLAKQLAEVISEKATHEGEEALTLSDADDQYLSSILTNEAKMATNTNTELAAIASTGDPLGDAILKMMKRAATPTAKARMGMAKEDAKKSRGAMKECRKAIEEVHKMLKANYFAKAAKKDGKKPGDDDGDGDFDHAGAMEKLQKAYGAVEKARTFAKAVIGNLEKAESVAGRAGQRGQEAGDPEAGFYEVPAGVKDLTPAAMAGANPGTAGGSGAPPMYPTDGSVYPGKAATGGDLAKFVKDGVISADVVALILEKAKADGELEALRRLPGIAAGGRRPYAFDMSKMVPIAAGTPDNAAMNKALFSGVDPNALGSNDEHTHNEATARVIGNFISSGHFGKSIFDPAFHGAAGSSR